MDANKKKDEPVLQKEERKEDCFSIPKWNVEDEHIGLLAAIVESSEDAIISKTLDGIIKSWNKGSEKMFGFTATEAIGKHISMLIPLKYIHDEKSITDRIRGNEFIEHYETIRTKKSGEEFYVSLTVSPLKDRNGNIIGISKIARDISGRKQAEANQASANKELIFQNEEKEKRAEELRIANIELVFQNEEKEKRAAELIIANQKLTFQNGEKEKRAAELIIANAELAYQNEMKIARAIQLEAVNKELESFSYSVSHDLRAPLRAIQGYAQMLKGNLAIAVVNPETDRLTNNIILYSKKMGQLIDDLLNFSRIGRQELAKDVVQMNELVTELCIDLKKEQSQRDIQIQINHLLPAQADLIAIKQVWLNLISNAIKYSKFKERAVIEINSELKENQIVYSVKDNGAGFDMRYVNKLFGVFQRLHSDEEFEGTGVGLAIVQRIIIKLGGKVWAEGKAGEGATFFFTLNKTE